MTTAAPLDPTRAGRAQYANRLGWTDVEPYEIVKTVTGRTVEIRQMNAERDKTFKLEWIPGGFAGHAVNQNQQRWIITSNPDAQVVRIRLHKDGHWYDRYRNRYALSDTPRKFYDYNF